MSTPYQCQLPPFGWKCNRQAGHPGPCAAIPDEETSTTPLTDALDAECDEHENYPRGPYQMLCRKLERELAEKDAQIVALRKKLEWQNMPNRREPTRGGYEFYINEEWKGLCSAALDDSVGGVASLMKVRFDPDDERVRVRRVLDDDAIFSDLENANAQIVALREAIVRASTYIQAGVIPHGEEKEVLLNLENALSTSPPPKVVFKSEHELILQQEKAMHFDNIEAARQQGFEAALSGIHELRSEEDELIAKFRWEEDKGDAEIGLQGWSGWVLTEDSPPVVLLEDVRPLIPLLKELAVHDAGTEETLEDFLAKHPIE